MTPPDMDPRIQLNALEAEATYLDGHTTAPRPARIVIHAVQKTLDVCVADAEPLVWNLNDVRRLQDVAGGDLLVLFHRNDPIKRVLVRDLADRAMLTDICPRLNRRAPIKGRTRLAAWGMAALFSVALIVLVLVPFMADQLARYIPPAGERALGDATLHQVRRALNETTVDPLKFCENPAGTAAMEKMRTRLMAGQDLPYPVQVHVLDHSLVNAFALPGGHVVFFRGLIDAAQSPEAVAAVLAHEIGHVVARDPTRIALRSAGSIGVLGLLFGDFAGGALVLFLSEQLIRANYSKEAEAMADVFAYKQLLDADLPPSGLADLFSQLREKYGDAEGILAHFTSHPSLGNRIEAARAATPTNRNFSVALSSEDWQALKAICN